MEEYISGARIVNALIFSASGNYLTEINHWRSEDESGRSLEAILALPPESAPISYFNDFQALTMAPKDKEDEEVWEDDDEEDEEDWDEDEDWDDEDDEDWDDEDEDDEDWDDEDEDDEDWDDEDDYEEDEE
jgi:hypothetical protein